MRVCVGSVRSVAAAVSDRERAASGQRAAPGGRRPTQSTPAASEPVPAFPDLTRLTWTIACEYFAQNSTVYHSVRTPGSLSDTVVVHHHGHAHGCTPTLPDSRCDSPRSFYDFYNITDFYHRELEETHAFSDAYDDFGRRKAHKVNQSLVALEAAANATAAVALLADGDSADDETSAPARNDLVVSGAYSGGGVAWFEVVVDGADGANFTSVRWRKRCPSPCSTSTGAA